MNYAHRPSGFLKALELAERVFFWFDRSEKGLGVSVECPDERFTWGNPRVWGKNFLSLRYLRGEGIQLAPRSTPLPVYFGARVRYVDRWDTRELRWRCPELVSQPLVDPHIVDDVERLTKIDDESQDFIVALGQMERSKNPIRLFETYLSKLKDGGVLYLTVHDKDKTINRRRPSTSLEHVLLDYESESDRELEIHLEEWLRLVGGITDEDELVRAISKLQQSEYEMPYHVWGVSEFNAMLDYLKSQLLMPFDVITSVIWRSEDSEVIYILKKNATIQPFRNKVSAAA